MNPHVKHRLTADREAILRYLAETGANQSEIALHFCVSRERIRQQMVHLRAGQFINEQNELLEKGWLVIKGETK